VCDFPDRQRGDDPRYDTPEITKAKADASRRRRELNMRAGWYLGGWSGPGAPTGAQRYILARAAEEQAAEERGCAAGDVTNADEALVALVRIQHEWR
jgi:hypothetical protein